MIYTKIQCSKEILSLSRIIVQLIVFKGGRSESKGKRPNQAYIEFAIVCAG